MSDIVAAAPAVANTPAPASSEASVTNDALTADELALESQDSEGLDTDGKEKEPKLTKKAEKEVEKRLKKLKLKVDGKEFEEEIDLDDDEALTRHLQMSKMGQKRAQEKAQLDKELKQFFAAMEEDPFSVLSKEMGMDVEAQIQKYIDKQIENAKKSPEQIEREKMENELKSIKAERERERQESEARQKELLIQQQYEHYDIQMEQALNKSSIPKTPYVVKKMADYMIVAVENGYDLSPEAAVALVQEEMDSDLKEMFGSLSEDKIESLLGDQVLNKLRKRRLAKAKESQAAVQKPNIQDTGRNAKTESKKEGDKVSFKKFFGV